MVTSLESVPGCWVETERSLPRPGSARLPRTVIPQLIPQLIPPAPRRTSAVFVFTGSQGGGV